MIKSKKGNIKLEGNKGIIKADLCCVMRALKEEKSFTKEEMLELVEDAYLSDEELHKKAEEAIEKLIEIILRETEGKADEQKEMETAE